MTSPVGVPITVAPSERQNLVRRYTEEVRAACLRWIGRGELPSQNNRGPDIDELLAISGVGQRDKNGHSLGGPYCGVGSSAMLVLGSRAMMRRMRGPLGAELAGEDAARRYPVVVHAGAKKLGRNVAAAGSYVIAPRGWTALGGGTYAGEVDPARMAGALVVVWHRGTTRETAWSGHVEIVLDYVEETTVHQAYGVLGADTLVTWAPNVVPGPTAIPALRALGIEAQPGQALTHVRYHADGSWRRKLYCVATLEG